METIQEIFTYELGERFFSHMLFHFIIVFFLYLVPPVMAAVDLKLAVSTARMLGERVRSHKLRKCLDKVGRYWLIQFAATAIGCVGLLFTWYNLPYIVLLVTLAIAATEIKSYREHMRRRKDGLAKLPETLEDLAVFMGGEAELKRLVTKILAERLEKAAAKG